MAELKTRLHAGNVEDFMRSIEDEQRRGSAAGSSRWCSRPPRRLPECGAAASLGTGGVHNRHASGRGGAWFLSGFSPRKRNQTLYFPAGFEGFPDLMKALGKHATSKACLYVKSPDDVHLPMLKKLIRESVQHIRKSAASHA